MLKGKNKATNSVCNSINIIRQREMPPSTF